MNGYKRIAKNGYDTVMGAEEDQLYKKIKNDFLIKSIKNSWFHKSMVILVQTLSEK
jgi:hypothetical protein